MLPHEYWKKTLLILRGVNFVNSAGMSMIVPFLSVYVVQLGVKNQADAILWAGMIFGANHLFISISSPFWGKLSDKIGPKMVMVPSGVAMAIVYALMAFATTPFHLLLLRCVFGMVSGFVTASVALQASVTPREKAGEALGKLQSSKVAGNLIGPFLGGILGGSIGIQHTFLVTAGVLFVSIIIVIIAIQPNRSPKNETQKAQGISLTAFGGVIRNNPLILALYFSTFLVAAGIQTIEPILTLYIKNTMGIEHNVQTMSGLIFSTSALGTVIAAPLLGRLGDRIGSQRILFICLIFGSLFYIPQPFVTSPILFSTLRFCCGLTIGGLIPSINALLRRVTKRENQGVAFGLNQTAMSAGNVVGPLFGGIMGRQYSVSSIFLGTSMLFFINFIWVFIVSKKAISRTDGSGPAMVT